MGTYCVFGSGAESRARVVRLSLAHIDHVGGAMNRTDKSSLMRKQKKSHKSGILDKQKVNVSLIDFIYIYFLRMLPPQLPAIF